MNEHQEARRQFVESIPVFQETKTPELISLKLLEEVGEFLVAYTDYARNEKTPERLQAVREETADVVHLLLDIAILTGFDLGEAMKEKLAKDKRRFPPSEMQRSYPGEPAQKVYMRRKIKLGERKPQ